LPIQWQSDPQQKTYEKADSYLKEIFGEMVNHFPDAPAMAVSKGTAFCTVAVYPWGDDDASITVRSYVVTGVEKTPDLMEFLLKENAKMRFGAFGLDDENDVFFEHTIVGSSCDKTELRASVLAVLSTADTYDDQIVQRFGGLRAVDRAGKPAAT